MISISKSATCLTPGCGRIAYSRGICQRCYACAKQMRQNGEATETELIDAGMMLPSRLPSISPFRAAFLAKTAKAKASTKTKVSLTTRTRKSAHAKR